MGELGERRTSFAALGTHSILYWNLLFFSFSVVYSWYNSIDPSFSELFTLGRVVLVISYEPLVAWMVLRDQSILFAIDHVVAYLPLSLESPCARWYLSFLWCSQRTWGYTDAQATKTSKFFSDLQVCTICSMLFGFFVKDVSRKI